jgi:hypothetical protein
MGAPIPHNSSALLLRFCGQTFAALALLGALLGGAQAQSPSAAAAARAHKSAHPHKKPAAAATPTPALPMVPVAVIPTAPAEPEAPPFPINDKPAPAAVTWDSQGLRIDASNSSLEQIMKDVSTATGTKVEGLDTDQRVFGAYGPGPARDVLGQLLHGSGYNVMMIGDQGQGTPRRIVLSSPHPGGAPAAGTPTAQENDEDTDVEDQQPQAPPIRPNFPPGMQPHMPQRMQPGQQGQQQPGQPGQPGQPFSPQN